MYSLDRFYSICEMKKDWQRNNHPVFQIELGDLADAYILSNPTMAANL